MIGIGGEGRGEERLKVVVGYLENQVFSPELSRGKELVWQRAVTSDDQRPYPLPPSLPLFFLLLFFFFFFSFI